jgi:SnoaL-like domain
MRRGRARQVNEFYPPEYRSGGSGGERPRHAGPQSTNIVLKSGATKHVMARQTDCFERRENGWELIHQHASVPAGGAWDGSITTG